MSEFDFGDGPGGAMRGVSVGIVTDNEDPKGIGRVKVRFPWRGLDDESYWARVTTPMAGTDYGFFYLPEVGDEVLVAFDDGDIHHPYVLGGLWNGNRSPPLTNSDGNNDLRQIKSRSGHRIDIDDNDTAGKIELETSAGNKVTLDDTTGGEKVTVEDSSGSNTIELNATSGEVSIDADSKISLSADEVELDGSDKVKATGKKVEITGDTKVELSSDATVEVSSKGQIKIDANAMVDVDGAIITLN